MESFKRSEEDFIKRLCKILLLKVPLWNALKKKKDRGPARVLYKKRENRMPVENYYFYCEEI